MNFFQSRLEKYEELIRKGALGGAKELMECYLEEGLQEESDVARLMAKVHLFDTTIKEAMTALEQEYPEVALKKMSGLRKILLDIKGLASLVAKEETGLEK